MHIIMTAFIAFVLAWGMMWRRQSGLAFGIVVGLIAGGIAANWLGPFESVTDVPIWLPPLPFGVVAVGFLIYAGLAWWGLVGSDADDD